MAAPEFPADRAEGKTPAPKRPLIMRYAARSDVGRIRAKNDDSAYVGRHLAVVADGMGGHAGGDVASAATVLDMIHLDHDDYDGDAGTVLADEIQTANSLLSELVHINPKLAGMGTTVTALLLAEGKLHFAHIGDSRAYRLRDGEFEQVSVDHTFVQRLIDEGRLRPEEAETHPHKNVLMRVLGDVDASPELDLDTLAVQAGERWLLCSDGLNYVAGHVVQAVRAEQPSFPGLDGQCVEIQLRAGIDVPQDAHEDVLVRMRFGLFGAEPALIDEPLDEGVVDADLFELAVAQPVGPGVADVGEVELSFGEEQGRDRGTHPGELGIDVDQLGQQGVGRLDFVGEDGAGVAVVVIMVQVDHVQDGRGGGDVAAGMATHAVGNDGEVPADVGGVVILGAYSADV